MTDLAAIAPYSAYFARSLESVATDLESYATLLSKWQAVQNLVSRETLDTVWTRHFADSLQVLKLIGHNDQSFIDFGSGGGLPALPLAIALKGTNRHFTLIEPNARKVSFLRTVARELGLPVVVESRRTDQIDSRETQRADVITSRALASLPQLCTWLAPFMAPNTRAILHKGREHLEEIAESRAFWTFNVVLTSSDTDPNGVLLTLSDLEAKAIR